MLLQFFPSVSGCEETAALTAASQRNSQYVLYGFMFAQEITDDQIVLLCKTQHVNDLPGLQGMHYICSITAGAKMSGGRVNNFSNFMATGVHSELHL